MGDWGFWCLASWCFAIILKLHLIDERVKELKRYLRKESRDAGDEARGPAASADRRARLKGASGFACLGRYVGCLRIMARSLPRE